MPQQRHNSPSEIYPHCQLLFRILNASVLLELKNITLYPWMLLFFLLMEILLCHRNPIRLYFCLCGSHLGLSHFLECLFPLGINLSAWRYLNSLSILWEDFMPGIYIWAEFCSSLLSSMRKELSTPWQMMFTLWRTVLNTPHWRVNINVHWYDLCKKRILNCNTKSSTTPPITGMTKRFVWQLQICHRKPKSLVQTTEKISLADNMNVVPVKDTKSEPLTELCYMKYTMWHTTQYEKVKLEVWSFNQCLPERITYKFTTVLLPVILHIFLEVGLERWESGIENMWYSTIWFKQIQQICSWARHMVFGAAYSESTGFFSNVLFYLNHRYFVQVQMILTLWSTRQAVIILLTRQCSTSPSGLSC